MRLRVQFRYRAETGEVEVFQVQDVDTGPRLPDHDARHEAAAMNLARIIDPHARVIEETETAGTEPDASVLQAPQDTEEAGISRTIIREGPPR